MKANYTKVGIGKLCMLFGKTRHAFYDKSWHNQAREEVHHLVLELVAQIRREIPRIGTPKLHRIIKKPLQGQGVKIGRDALHQLLLNEGLIIRNKKRYVRTTHSHHWLKKYPNLIKEITVEESEQIWVSDITYIRIEDDFNYLSLITDAYSKLIVGYCLYPSLEAEGSIIALRMALEQRTKTTFLIHHSDRGTQYCCSGYVDLLQKEKIKISMTEKGDPYENAIAERVNGILKTDFDLGRVFKSSKEALTAITASIKAYNTLRPHMSCDYLTPEQAHQMYGPLNKMWKNKKYPNPSEVCIE
ncbi:MAG: IS3 family transposase [Mangrovibacterium sp.]